MEEETDTTDQWIELNTAIGQGSLAEYVARDSVASNTLTLNTVPRETQFIIRGADEPMVTSPPQGIWALNQVEVLIAFMSWVTSIKGEIPLGEGQDPSTAVQLLNKFFEANNVPYSARANFESFICKPSTDMDELGLNPQPKSGTDFFASDDTETNAGVVTQATEPTLSHQDLWESMGND